MKYPFKALIVLLLMAVAIAIGRQFNLAFDPIHVGLLSVFMCGSSILIHHFTIGATKENPKRFPAYFMAITGIKMLFYLLAISGYAYFFKEQAIPVVVGFLILYIVYTYLEVASILSELRKTEK